MYISKKNSKINCPYFSLPPIVTCKKRLACHTYCYAKKVNRYPNVVKSRMKNLLATKQRSFVSEMTKKIRKLKPNYFRFHESGDFYSSQYAKKIFEIARELPEIHFHAHTKRQFQIFNTRPENFTLIYSLDKINPELQTIKNLYDSVALVTDCITNCPAQKSKKIKCMIHCTKCINKKQAIIFKKH